ncbi:DUF3089 domain-containing protein [Niveispirillum fermenti]|uniref:DUF3089 domain-containing protein n=1 Tax=Niveispirillum fermenti TaxID=1233113 RepID=UPI003A893633
MKQIASLLMAAILLSGTSTVALATGGTPPSFADQTPPPAPDYARPEAWAARAGAPGASSIRPPGAEAAPSDAAVDVFYVHPTTYRSKGSWNQDIADTATNAWTDASVIARQAGVFNGCCRIYAPRYRQGSTLSFMAMDGDGGRAFDLAYTDVERAFDHYLKHDNKGRPFILAGHSQGARHLMVLLERRIDGTELARRMVAAYVVGVNLSEGDFGKTYKSLTACDTPAQTGCVVGWNATLAQTDIPMVSAAGERRYVEWYGDDPGKRILCINPVSFDRGKPETTADQALGAVPGAPGEGAMQATQPGAVAARCVNGFLVVEPAAGLDLTPLPGGSMHYHDYGLFYADIRTNARLRIDAFLKAARQ